MAILPYNRVINVSLTRNSAFPTRRGFGTPLFLQSTVKAGINDATVRTKLYASMDEVAADWASSDDFYKAAEAAFSQNPRPLQIKTGYYVAATATAALMKTQMDLIYDYDSDWYFLVPETLLRDVAKTDGLVEWIEAKNKQMFLDSNAVLMQSAADTTNVAARFKGSVVRTSVFYHTDVAEHLAMSAAAKAGTFNFDDADTAYTLKFKSLQSINNVNLGSAVITAITGFVPGTGESETAGHCANTYIDIGNQNFLVEGTTLTENVFIDEIHASDWIIARTEEEVLGIFLKNKRIPFTDKGMETIASGARSVMRIATRAGLIAEDLNPLTGEYEASVTYDIPSVFDVPESQRKARIAPAISVTFRYAGAVHYATIRYTMTF